MLWSVANVKNCSCNSNRNRILGAILLFCLEFQVQFTRLIALHTTHAFRQMKNISSLFINCGDTFFSSIYHIFCCCILKLVEISLQCKRNWHMTQFTRLLNRAPSVNENLPNVTLTTTITVEHEFFGSFNYSFVGIFILSHLIRHCHFSSNDTVCVDSIRKYSNNAVWRDALLQHLVCYTLQLVKWHTLVEMGALPL